MKKRFLLTILIIAIVLTGTMETAQARTAKTKRAAISQTRELRNTEKDVRNVINLQDDLCNKRDYDKLYELFKPDFINNDGFSKELYFKQIKDTWNSYPDITYKTEIRSVNVTNNYATVETYETAVATTTEDFGAAEIVGEVHGVGHSIYYLEKVGQKWQIASENVLEEKTSLAYGEARYLNINLNAPTQVGAGQSYSTNLTINAPDDTVIVGFIGQEKLIYPQGMPDEVYRKLSDDNTLERVFTANNDNVNEFNIASIGITRAELPDKDNLDRIRIYMSGMAFVMTRVNVIPENKFIDIGENDGQEDK